MSSITSARIYYPQRRTGNYLGPSALDNYGATPQWPAGRSTRIFADINPDKAAPDLRKAQAANGASVLIYGPELSAVVAPPFSAPRRQFVPAALDLGNQFSESMRPVHADLPLSRTALQYLPEPIAVFLRYSIQDTSSGAAIGTPAAAQLPCAQEGDGGNLRHKPDQGGRRGSLLGHIAGGWHGRPRSFSRDCVRACRRYSSRTTAPRR